MIRTRFSAPGGALFLWLSLATLTWADDVKPLWSIGQEDNSGAEFALSPNRYGEFAADGFFVVGQSDPKQQWPYVHPGPDDSWAGGKNHTFTIAFGLQAAPSSGDCRLSIDLVDTQNAIPPRLQIDVNGRKVDHATPKGAGDASVYGDPGRGREHKFLVTFPARQLRSGTNVISITTLSGSWILYDWLGLETPAGCILNEPQGTFVRGVSSAPMLIERQGQLCQTIRVDLLHLGAAAAATVRVTGAEPVALPLQPGTSVADVPVPAVKEPTDVVVQVVSADQVLAQQQLTLKPVRQWIVYLLPHSHVDIGYTHVQTDVERSHWQYYEQAIAASRKTADYPPGAQFKWNAEVLWATDSYLKQATPEKQQEFLDAVRQGWIGLDALYGNELTALCRPEELIRLVDYGNRLKQQYQLPIDSAMISDVPGYTWGLIPVLAESGVKYFSIGPNGGHRIGYTLSEYGDKPFWWRSPSGQQRILCWIPRTGYWQGFRGANGLISLLQQMDESGYPYDLLQLRHCLGDNAGPGVDLSDFVKDWNSRYAYPKLIIATTSEMMQELERRYGDQLPELSGDFTPYWEDGAGSSARETALNRAAAERLTQAETMFALLQPDRFPTEAFDEAWRNVVLYDEHTWGAHCSISQPDSEFTKAQWAIKQKFALDADSQSYDLLQQAVAKDQAGTGTVSALDVFNTCSWTRTDLVRVPGALAVAGEIVRNAQGETVPSQRLASGELAFLATDLPPLAGQRFTLHSKSDSGSAAVSLPTPAAIDGLTLSNGRVAVTVNQETGAIASLTWNDHDFVLPSGDQAPQLNDYYYVAGRKPDQPQRPDRPEITVTDGGPLVVSARISSTAPGCNSLQRTVSVIAGLDRVDLTNVVDKKNIYDQEGVHFAFPMHVPEGTIRMDIPWAVAAVESDQLRGACKNYFTVQRWADVANDHLGITLATLDAPLLEVGGITCDPVAVGWIKQLEPTQTLYSYVMNNYWETNYKAGQEGPTTFRYSLQPHGAYDAQCAQQFGINCSQPLVAVPVDPQSKPVTLPLRISGDGVMLTCLKPSNDQKALVLRLFNSSAEPTQAHVTWQEPEKKSLQLCNLAEQPVGSAPETIELAPWQFVTLRLNSQSTKRSEPAHK